MNSTYRDRHGNVIDSMSTLNPPQYTMTGCVLVPKYDEVPEASEEQDTYHSEVVNPYAEKQKKLRKKYKKIQKKIAKADAKLSKITFKQYKLDQKSKAIVLPNDTSKNAKDSISEILRKECARSEIFNELINEKNYPSNLDFEFQLHAVRIFDGLAWVSDKEIPLDILKKHPELYVYNLTGFGEFPTISDSTVEIPPDDYDYVGLILSQKALLGDGEHSRKSDAPIEYLEAEIGLGSLFTISQVWHRD